MPFAARDEERCLTFIIYAPGNTVNRHPSIKVQRAQRHIALGCRRKQPSLADLTASLTQRKDAEATAVRRHVLRQGNDALVIVETTSADRHVEPLDAQLRQCDDDGFLQRLNGAAFFPDLHVHILLPCQTRRDVLCVP